MRPEIVGLIGIVILVVMLFSKMWVGLSMVLVGFVGCWYFTDFPTALNILGMVPYTQSTDYTLSCMPMFVLMGVVLSYSGLGNDLYSCAARWLGRVKGGLCMATSVACGLFAAVCGDSAVTAVTMGKVAYPPMKKQGYADTTIAGSICSGGTIGVMIPPSVCFIIYGLITQESIGTLFMAGILPGITQVLFYILTVVVLGKLKPDSMPNGQRYSMKEKLDGTKTVWPVLILFVIIMGGIYGGWFTPTEAGAIGAVASIVISLCNKRLTRKTFKAACVESLKNTATVFVLICGAYVFLRFVAFSQLPSFLSTFVVELNTIHHVGRGWIILCLVIMYIILGMFLDVMACIMLTLGIVYPIVSALGYNLIWFGVIMVRVMEIGMLSPPFGLNLFVVAKSTNLKLKDVYKGVLPFLTADLFHILLLLFVPAVSLLIPGLM